MSLIQNLVARLTLDSTAFDRNAKGASQSMRGMMSSSLALQRTVAGLAGAYIGVRGVTAAIKSVVGAAMEQQSAERRLAASLALTGDATEKNLTAIKQYAAALQKQTTYGDEEILNQIAYAKSLGLSTNQIGEATIAAMGLAAAYNKDLGQAMKIITLATKGETGQLKEMGIALAKNLSPQEKYNELIRQMTEKYRLAQDATRDTAGLTAQLNNSWSDLKENLGTNVLPVVNDFIKGLNLIIETANKVPGAISQLGGHLDVTRNWAEDPVVQRLRDRGAFNRQRTPSPSPAGTEGAAELSELTQAARDRVVELNDALNQQIFIEAELGAGRKHAAETMKYSIALEEAYGDDLETQMRLYEEYAKDLQVIEDLRSRAVAGEYLASLKDEAKVLKLRQAGMEGQARAQEMLNDFRRQGVKLTKEETDQIKKLAEANQRLAENRVEKFGEGVASAIRQMQSEMKTLGDIAHEVTMEVRDGIVDSLTDAVFEGEDLGESLRNVAKEAAKIAFRMALTNLIGLAVGGAAVGHSGGVIGSSGFATRRDSPAAWAGAPRLHDGLRPDEFRFIGQRGEKITSVGGVAAENRLLGRVVSLLERRQTVNLNARIVDGRDVLTRERFEGREGEQMTMYHVGRNQ
jgi:hypothetical protein